VLVPRFFPRGPGTRDCLRYAQSLAAAQPASSVAGVETACTEAGRFSPAGSPVFSAASGFQALNPGEREGKGPRSARWVRRRATAWA